MRGIQIILHSLAHLSYCKQRYESGLELNMLQNNNGTVDQYLHIQQFLPPSVGVGNQLRKFRAFNQISTVQPVKKGHQLLPVREGYQRKMCYDIALWCCIKILVHAIELIWFVCRQRWLLNFCTSRTNWSRILCADAITCPIVPIWADSLAMFKIPTVTLHSPGHVPWVGRDKHITLYRDDVI